MISGPLYSLHKGKTSNVGERDFDKGTQAAFCPSVEEKFTGVLASCKTLELLVEQISRYVKHAEELGHQDKFLDVLQDRAEMLPKAAQSLLADVRTVVAVTRFKRTFRKQLPAKFKIQNDHGSRGLILIVEDEPEIAEEAMTMLVEDGYQVVIADDGAQAVNIYGQLKDQVSLVLLDYFLPSLDGDAVFQEMRRLKSDAKVILVSGFLALGVAGKGKLDKMLQDGLRGFLPKPYTRKLLVDQVAGVLKPTSVGSRG
ncbi:MAG: hypothetical protein DME42_00485 [Verrucomicrobia bacterium]|nr:MAG: hypothetical protein DME42_00485 [Verrucomicrobiota bacterium]